MKCPRCKGGNGPDRYNAESLAKHLVSFHHMAPDVEARVAEADARSRFVGAIDSVINEVVPQETPIAITEQSEASEAVKRLELHPTRAMSLSSKLCWSWLATVLLISLMLVALVAITKV